jgi:hypothetical protein
MRSVSVARGYWNEAEDGCKAVIGVGVMTMVCTCVCAKATQVREQKLKIWNIDIVIIVVQRAKRTREQALDTTWGIRSLLRQTTCGTIRARSYARIGTA